MLARRRDVVVLAGAAIGLGCLASERRARGVGARGIRRPRRRSACLAKSMLEQNEEFGLLPLTQEITKLAEENLEAFRAKIKNKQRRRAVPQGSTPAETT